MNKVKHFWSNLKRTQKIMIIISIAFLILIGTGIWYYAAVIDNPSRTLGNKPDSPFKDDPGIGQITQAGDADDALDNWVPSQYYDKNIVNFVLLGFDTDQERREMEGYGWGEGFIGARPDSIRVVSVNLDTKQASIISVPRDTYIQIANSSTKEKVNSSYMFGRIAAHNQGITNEKDIDQMGLDYVMKTISNVFGGIPMDYYMAIDFDTIINFVDAIGGVQYDVEQNIYQPTDGQLMLEKGKQTLNGTQAYIYLQDRKNFGSDFARTTNHTKFLITMVMQLKHSDNLMEALKFILLDNGLGTIETNLSADQLMSLANLSRKMNLSQIQSYLLDGNGDMMDGTSYVVMNQQNRSDIIKEVFDYDFQVQPQENLVDTVPKPPVSFAGSLTGDGVALRWEAGDTHNLAYNIWRNNTQIATNVTEKMYLDTGYTSGVLTYEIQAVNGESVSAKVSATVQAGPTSPTNLTAVFDPTAMTIKLTWDYSGSGVTYTIYKSDGDGSGSRYAHDIKDESYKDTDVEYGKTYTYWVTVVKSDGSESSRVSVQVTTSAACTLTIAANGGTGTGTTTPVVGAYAEGEGAVVNIDATPNAGMKFDRWIVTGNGKLDKDDTIADNKITVTGNCMVTAKFDLDASATFTVNLSRDPASPADSGTVTGSGSYAAGAEVTIEAIAKPNFHFVKWNGDLPSADNPKSFTMPSANLTITAVFEEDAAPLPTTHVVMISYEPADGTCGTASVQGGNEYEEGETVNLSVDPIDGYKFDHWQDGPLDGLTDISFVMPDHDVYMTAIFVEAS
jgi:LCP family protein required for cell wall assembly